MKKYKGTTPMREVEELTTMFSIEKSLDIASTMLLCAKEYNLSVYIYFWGRVIQILKNKTHD